MNVYFIPTYSDENDYLNNITNGLIANGVNVLSEKSKGKTKAIFESILSAVKHDEYIVHFNWIENKVKSRCFKDYINFIIIKIWIGILRWFKAKICWTMHNKVPHNRCKNDMTADFYSWFLPKCDMILVHCCESEKILRESYNYNGLILNVPHGNYCNNYHDTVDYKNISAGQFLYFGAVSKYKNVPILIESFERVLNQYPFAKLRICGRCRDAQLDEEICSIVNETKNIEYVNDFLSQEELDEELKTCCAVVLPYDKESMLNSGSAIMSMSRGRAIIIPDFGYISDIKDEDFILAYDYTDKDSHINNLADTWIKAINESMVNSDYWEIIGKRAYKFADENLDWNNICKEICESYDYILTSKWGKKDE